MADRLSLHNAELSAGWPPGRNFGPASLCPNGGKWVVRRRRQPLLLGSPSSWSPASMVGFGWALCAARETRSVLVQEPEAAH